MKLECFLYDGWQPRIRAASRRRAWMDDTPESFAYRCLPLSMANAHGWEIGNPAGFWARWNGGSDTGDIEIKLDNPETGAAVSLFGQGTITFHIMGLLRTEPGWNLWIGGPPNAAKDGIAPLSGVVETDWSPYSFTMNWRFTRPNYWVRFEADEAIAFFFPIDRRAIEATVPSFHAIDEAPELRTAFEQWSQSRDQFHQEMRDNPPREPADKWQKLYYRGVCPNGDAAADHQTKVRLREFAGPGGGAPGGQRAPEPAADQDHDSTPSRAQPDRHGGI